MGRRYVAPPFTACPEWSERGGAGIDFSNRPFLKMWVRTSPQGRELAACGRQQKVEIIKFSGNVANRSPLPSQGRGLGG